MEHLFTLVFTIYLHIIIGMMVLKDFHMRELKPCFSLLWIISPRTTHHSNSLLHNISVEANVLLSYMVPPSISSANIQILFLFRFRPKAVRIFSLSLERAKKKDIDLFIH